MQAGASRILLRRQASRQVARHCTPSGLSGCRATPIRRSSAVSTHRGSPSPIPRCSPAAAPWHRQQTARYSSTPSTFGSINSPRNSSPEAYPSSSDSDAASPSPSSSAAETDASSSVHHDDDAASSSSSSISREEQEQGDPFSAAAEEELLNAPSPSRQPLGKIERRLSITFTCTVPNCGHRSTHEFSRHAYEKGIVLVQCPGCSSRHLIADHLGWFNSDDLTQGGKYKTIEALLAAKGEQVARASVLPDGTVEVDVPDEEEEEQV